MAAQNIQVGSDRIQHCRRKVILRSRWEGLSRDAERHAAGRRQAAQRGATDCQRKRIRSRNDVIVLVAFEAIVSRHTPADGAADSSLHHRKTFGPPRCLNQRLKAGLLRPCRIRRRYLIVGEDPLKELLVNPAVETGSSVVFGCGHTTERTTRTGL